MNACIFSPRREYRYTLAHTWNLTRPAIAWIGLNPSTADEQKLDPTLLRIRNFSSQWGYGAFIMLNLFAFRTPCPAEMKLAADPIGPDNNKWIMECAGKVDKIIACWGNGGKHLGRAVEVCKMLREKGREVLALEINTNGSPKHPLARGLHRIPDTARPRKFCPPVRRATGPCLGCGGDGEFDHGLFIVPCDVCRGTGRARNDPSSATAGGNYERTN